MRRVKKKKKSGRREERGEQKGEEGFGRSRRGVFQQSRRRTGMGGVLQKGEEGSDKVARGGGGVSSAGVGGWLCRNGGVLSVIDGEGSGRGAFLVGSRWGFQCVGWGGWLCKGVGVLPAGDDKEEGLLQLRVGVQTGSRGWLCSTECFSNDGG